MSSSNEIENREQAPGRMIGSKFLEYDKIGCRDTGCYLCGHSIIDNPFESIITLFGVATIITTLCLNILNMDGIEWWYLFLCYLIYIIFKIGEAYLMYKYILGCFNKCGGHCQTCVNHFGMNWIGTKRDLAKHLLKRFGITWSIENIVMTVLFYTQKDKLIFSDNIFGWMLIIVVCLSFIYIWFTFVIKELVLLIYSLWLHFADYCCITPYYACKNRCSKRDNNQMDV